MNWNSKITSNKFNHSNRVQSQVKNAARVNVFHSAGIKSCFSQYVRQSIRFGAVFGCECGCGGERWKAEAESMEAAINASNKDEIAYDDSDMDWQVERAIEQMYERSYDNNPRAQ